MTIKKCLVAEANRFVQLGNCNKLSKNTKCPLQRPSCDLLKKKSENNQKFCKNLRPQISIGEKIEGRGKTGSHANQGRTTSSAGSVTEIAGVTAPWTPPLLPVLWQQQVNDRIIVLGTCSAPLLPRVLFSFLSPSCCLLFGM